MARVVRRDSFTLDENIPAMIGDAHAYMHPWDWDDKTAQQLADELDEQLKRKRPLGFAPWPQEGGTDVEAVGSGDDPRGTRTNGVDPPKARKGAAGTNARKSRKRGGK